jgi:hypothetical protein
MNEPHENLDPDPFAHDASRRPSRLRRTIVRHVRPGARGTCARVDGTGRLGSARRQVRPCPRTDRRPLR